MGEVTIEYHHRFPYQYPGDGGGDRFPGLLVQLRNPISQESVETVAHIDSGATTSLFDGELASAIGIEVLAGRRFAFTFVNGGVLEARVHEVWLQHEHLGELQIPLAFSTGAVRRNVLGRDFLAYVQVGINERDLEFYVVMR